MCETLVHSVLFISGDDIAKIDNPDRSGHPVLHFCSRYRRAKYYSCPHDFGVESVREQFNAD